MALGCIQALHRGPPRAHLQCITLLPTSLHQPSIASYSSPSPLLLGHHLPFQIQGGRLGDLGGASRGSGKPGGAHAGFLPGNPGLGIHGRSRRRSDGEGRRERERRRTGRAEKGLGIRRAKDRKACKATRICINTRWISWLAAEDASIHRIAASFGSDSSKNAPLAHMVCHALLCETRLCLPGYSMLFTVKCAPGLYGAPHSAVRNAPLTSMVQHALQCEMRHALRC